MSAIKMKLNEILNMLSNTNIAAVVGDGMGTTCGRHKEFSSAFNNADEMYNIVHLDYDFYAVDNGHEWAVWQFSSGQCYCPECAKWDNENREWIFLK